MLSPFYFQLHSIPFSEYFFLAEVSIWGADVQAEFSTSTNTSAMPILYPYYGNFKPLAKNYSLQWHTSHCVHTAVLISACDDFAEKCETYLAKIVTKIVYHRDYKTHIQTRCWIHSAFRSWASEGGLACPNNLGLFLPIASQKAAVIVNHILTARVMIVFSDVWTRVLAEVSDEGCAGSLKHPWLLITYLLN